MNIRSVINIRYAQIRSLDLSNGEGIGVALFVQGCRFRCPNCFNPETWDFNGGKEWTPKVKDKLLELVSRPYINRLSILGGEPLTDENIDDVLDLVNRFRLLSHKKAIWLYTGYCVKEIYSGHFILNPSASNITNTHTDFEVVEESIRDEKRDKIIKQCNVLIDGQYIDSQRDITIPYRGSKNQRLIDIEKSVQKGKIVLWDV